MPTSSARMSVAWRRSAAGCGMALGALLLAGAWRADATAAGGGVQLQRTMIPMPDGVRLAVTLYLPDAALRGARLPVLLEYLPYRKDDDEAQRDYGNHAYFAQHGFVGARVDIRGFGASEGVPPEREYSAQEQADGEQVIAWLARQPWSNGNVGMLGISWGGFNSMQMAMRRPPALKAILAVDATEALFTEDVHYIDGIFHVDEFELTMDLDQGRSGAPDFSLDERVIGPRMDSPPWSLTYLRQQRDAPFWHAPVRPLGSITIPCFVIGGFQDGYRDSIARMLEQVHAPLKVWIGPWNHAFPDEADYGPLVGWRAEAVRWFDHWLRGIDNGVEREPNLIVYLQHWHPPGAQSQDIPGEWRSESWPQQGLEATTLYLQPDHALGASAARSGSDELRYVPTAGVESGFWWGDLQVDQRPVDAYSLVYDSAPLTEPMALFGLPQVVLEASADAPLANWFARLEDVAPDGRVTLITGAGLSGAQHESMAEPKDLQPGERLHLRLALHLTSWLFPPGHRIRLAISNALWPMMWPTPYAMSTVLYLGGPGSARIELPRIPLQGRVPPPFGKPEPVATRTDIREGESAWPGSWTLLRDEAAARSTVIWQGATATDYPWGRFEHTEKLTYVLDDPHPEAASVTGESVYVQRAGTRELTWRGRLRIESDRSTFHYHYTRELLVDGKPFRARSWDADIPRDHQ